MSVLKIYKGDNKTYRGIVKDKDDNVKDVSGGRLFFTVRAQKGAAQALIEKDSNEAGEAAITDGPNGVVEVYLVPDDTKDLDEGKYWYDAEILLDGKYHTLVVNRINIKEDMTKH